MEKEIKECGPGCRVILHADMDAFYASVEQRDHPEYRGRPVIVGADPKGGRGRGVVAAASYEARKFGIHSAQPISRAFRLCPGGIFLRGDHGKYSAVSDTLMGIFRDYTPLVEPLSLDEAFLDITGTLRLWGSPDSVGRDIKRRIWEQENLKVSIGIGPNKLIAKIASDSNKPDGFVVVHPGEWQSFLGPLPVQKLWGVGRVTGEVLSGMGIRTVSDLARLDVPFLEQKFGKFGRTLWEFAHGIDDSPVTPAAEARSISNETTFETDVADPEFILDTLLQLSEKVAFRLRAQRLCARTVHLKARTGDFKTSVRSRTLAEPVDLGGRIFSEVRILWNALDARGLPMRLLGVGASRLESSALQQEDLFNPEGRQRQVTAALDRVKKKFGDGAIGRGINR
jgi:nucleotidyltransferase/DNA polymerase involved in DNA repair